MNKHILWNTIFALFIPSVSVFPAISALAYVQPPTKTIHTRQITILQSPVIVPTPLTTITFNTSLRNLPTTDFLTQPFLISSGGNVVAPTDANCNNAASDVLVETPEGIRTLSTYCQARSNDNQQSVLRSENPVRSAWESPYWLNGNVCRERGTDMVCLTPQGAAGLRWLIPSPPNSQFWKSKFTSQYPK